MMYPQGEAAKLRKPKRSETVETESSSLTGSDTTPDSSPLSDDSELISQAEALFEEEKVLAAARLLRNVKDSSLLKTSHKAILTLADELENAISDLTGPPSAGWTKQGESQGSRRPTVIYYKFDEDCNLTCRIETPIEASLLVPLLSVLNETDLYSTWVPYNRMPRLGLCKSVRLEQAGRANQTVQIVCDVPWPMQGRDVIIHAVAVDEIDEQGSIVVRMNSIAEGPAVPPVDPGIERIDFEGALLFRVCPPDHELLAKRETKSTEPMFLVSFKMHLDSHLSAVPPSLVNFVTRTVIGQMWAMLLKVAEGVRDGRRLEHKQAIESRADLYKWIEQRTTFMLSMINERDDERFIAYLQS